MFGDSKDIMDELKNIDAILQNMVYKSNIQILMYENCIRKYMSNCRLSFFNTTITLSLEQRHIEYMEKLFKEIWESERYNISKFKEEAVTRISDLLNYINILKSTVEN